MSINCDIVLIDSGVNHKHKAFENHKVEGVSIVLNSNGQYNICHGFEDNIGHGTAVYHILKKNKVNADIYIIKLFDYKLNNEIDLDCMLFALDYIYHKVNCKIIHLSLGITHCGDIEAFREICSKLYNKGVIIVSAFDNLGAVSYPAAFEEVIGVDIGADNMQIGEYEYVHNSLVNVRCPAKELKLPFLNNEYKNVIGSSFMAPYITNILIENFDKIKAGESNALNILRQNAKKEFYFEHNEKIEKSFDINSAVLFPFNKEMHSIMAFNDLCGFDIRGIYDTKYLGNIGKKVSEVLKYSKSADFEIMDIDKLNWDDDFETFVMGHVRELSGLLKKDIAKIIIEKCIQHKKKLYCFDDISMYSDTCDLNSIQYYYPKVDKSYSANNLFGKLRCVGTPVIAIMGTSSKQGKFTLQLCLRQRFLKEGYKLGQLGTEPSSLLYGFDEVYPIGYDSTVKLTGYESINYINKLMGRIEDKNVDLILAGSQSQTVHFTTGNLRCYSLQNVEFLLGVEPDAIILCVNTFDDNKYIRRTISFMENYQGGKVIALALYPVKKDIKWTTIGSRLDYEDSEKLDNKIKELSSEFKIPCYILANEIHMDNLAEHCINFFCQE